MKPGSFLHEPQRACGNTLTEYGVIGVLVLIVVLPAIGLAGGSLNSLLKGWRQDMSSHRDQALQAASARELEKLDTLSRPAVLNSQQPVAEKSSLSQTVATLGAIGATRAAADQITLLAQQLKDKQAVTDAQYNMLSELANQGHILGTIAGLLEDAAAHASSSQEFLASQVTFKGQVISIMALSNIFGYMPEPGLRTDFYYGGTSDAIIPENLLNPPNGAYGELQKFLDLYHQTMDSLNVADPSVKQTVTALSTQIALLNATIDQVGFQVSSGKITADQIRDTEVSIVTHQDSASICKTGQGTDSGVSCTP